MSTFVIAIMVLLVSLHVSRCNHIVSKTSLGGPRNQEHVSQPGSNIIVLAPERVLLSQIQKGRNVQRNNNPAPLRNQRRPILIERLSNVRKADPGLLNTHTAQTKICPAGKTCVVIPLTKMARLTGSQSTRQEGRKINSNLLKSLSRQNNLGNIKRLVSPTGGKRLTLHNNSLRRMQSSGSVPNSQTRNQRNSKTIVVVPVSSLRVKRPSSVNSKSKSRTLNDRMPGQNTQQQGGRPWHETLIDLIVAQQKTIARLTKEKSAKSRSHPRQSETASTPISAQESSHAALLERTLMTLADLLGARNTSLAQNKQEHLSSSRSVTQGMEGNGQAFAGRAKDIRVNTHQQILPQRKLVRNPIAMQMPSQSARVNRVQQGSGKSLPIKLSDVANGPRPKPIQSAWTDVLNSAVLDNSQKPSIAGETRKVLDLANRQKLLQLASGKGRQGPAPKRMSKQVLPVQDKTSVLSQPLVDGGQLVTVDVVVPDPAIVHTRKQQHPGQIDNLVVSTPSNTVRVSNNMPTESPVILGNVVLSIIKNPSEPQAGQSVAVQTAGLGLPDLSSLAASNNAVNTKTEPADKAIVSKAQDVLNILSEQRTTERTSIATTVVVIPSVQALKTDVQTQTAINIIDTSPSATNLTPAYTTETTTNATTNHPNTTVTSTSTTTKEPVANTTAGKSLPSTLAETNVTITVDMTTLVNETVNNTTGNATDVSIGNSTEVSTTIPTTPEGPEEPVVSTVPTTLEEVEVEEGASTVTSIAMITSTEEMEEMPSTTAIEITTLPSPSTQHEAPATQVGQTASNTIKKDPKLEKADRLNTTDIPEEIEPYWGGNGIEASDTVSFSPEMVRRFMRPPPNATTPAEVENAVINSTKARNKSASAASIVTNSSSTTEEAEEVEVTTTSGQNTTAEEVEEVEPVTTPGFKNNGSTQMETTTWFSNWDYFFDPWSRFFYDKKPDPYYWPDYWPI